MISGYKEKRSIAMNIILPERIKKIIETIGNKTRKNSAMKIYAGRYLRSCRSDKYGYFECPSTVKQNIRYWISR
jgi:hypothetical protein